MVLALILGAITALIARSLLKTAIRCRETLTRVENRLQLAAVILAGMLILIAIAALAFTLITLLSAILQILTPGRPAPYLLLPWFIGFCATAIPWQFAASILNILRKDESPLY